MRISHWVSLASVGLVTLMLAPTAGAVNFVLSGEYRCELRGDLRQGNTITQAVVTTIFVTGQGIAFASGQLTGEKSVMSNPPFIDSQVNYSNVLASGSTFNLASFNGNGFFSLGWQQDPIKNPSPNGSCKVQTTAIRPSGTINQFRLACNTTEFFFLGTCFLK